MAGSRALKGALNQLFDSLEDARGIAIGPTVRSGYEHSLIGKSGLTPDELRHLMHTDHDEASVSLEEPMQNANLWHGFGPAASSNLEPYYSLHTHPDDLAHPSRADLFGLMSMFYRDQAPDQHTMSIFSTPTIPFGRGDGGYSLTRFNKSGLPRGWASYLDAWPRKYDRAVRSGALNEQTLRDAITASINDTSPLYSGRWGLPLMHMADRGNIMYNFAHDNPAIDDLQERVYEQLQRANAFDYARGGLI